MIRGLLRRGVGIAVAGRRLGRVAAAMIGWTLEQAGLDPTFLLRGAVSGLGVPARAGLGRHAVVDLIESPGFVLDEPPGPSMVVLLDDAGAVDEGVLANAVDCVGPTGYVLTGPGMPPPSLCSGGRVASVSLERGSTWWAADLREERGRYRFRVFHRGRFAAEIRLQVPGRANVLGALAALAACDRAEVPTRQIKQALEDFAGVSGGFASRGSYRGVTLVDDDAADPSDVADVLALARTVHGRRRLWAVVGASGPPRPAIADGAGLGRSRAGAGRCRRRGRLVEYARGGWDRGPGCRGPRRGPLRPGPAPRTRRRPADARVRRRGNDSRCIPSTTSARSSRRMSRWRP